MSDFLSSEGKQLKKKGISRKSKNDENIFSANNQQTIKELELRESQVTF